MVRLGSIAGITALQQQRPVHLDQRTLCTRQIIGPCAGCFTFHLYAESTQRGPTHAPLIAQLWLNVSLGEIIATKPCWKSIKNTVDSGLFDAAIMRLLATRGCKLRPLSIL